MALTVKDVLELPCGQKMSAMTCSVRRSISPEVRTKSRAIIWISSGLSKVHLSVPSMQDG